MLTLFVPSYEIRCMKVKKTIILLCILLGNLNVYSQIDSFYVHRAVRTTGLSILESHDDYLSQLNYIGLGLRLNDERMYRIQGKDKNWFVNSESEFVGGLLINPEATSSLEYFRANFNYGLNRIFNFDFDAMTVGISNDYELGLKFLARNVNNPFNLDLNTELNLQAAYYSSFYLFAREINYNFSLQSPFLGVMFIPNYMDPYFNSFDLKEVVKISSFHNNLAYKLKLNTETQLRKFSIVFSVYSEHKRWLGNDLNFSYKETGILLGIKFDYAYFGGWKKKAPGSAITFPF